MKKKIIGILIIGLLLTACGQAGSAEATMEEESPNLMVENGEIDWKTDRWVYDAGNVSLYSLYPGEQIRGMDTTEPQNYSAHSVEYCTYGNNIYAVNGFYWQMTDGWEEKYYLSCYEGDTGEIRKLPLSFSELEEYADQELRITNVNAQSDQELVVFVQGWQQDMTCTMSYLALHMTLEGDILSVTDLYSALTELGMDPGISFEEIYVDADGFYYVIPYENNLLKKNRVVVLNSSGEVIDTMESGEGYVWTKWAMMLPDGRPAFSWRNDDLQSIQLAVYDKTEKQMHILLEAKGLTDAWLWTLSEDGYLYYVDSENELMRCDISSGAVEDCLYYPELGLETDGTSVRMVIGTSGLPELVGVKNMETVICQLSQESNGEEPIQLVSLIPDCEYLKENAAEVSRENEKHPIYVQYPAEYNDTAYRDRIMAELTSGKGADLYYVTAEDMQILAKQGALADLTDLISSDTLSEIYPGVLEMSTIDGKLSGIALEAYPIVMYVSEELWPEDSWTLEEALGVMEAHPELQYPVMSTSSLDCNDVFQYLVMEDLGCSSFLDLEKGTCDFDNPLFIRALELAGTYRGEIDYEEAQEIYSEKNWVALKDMVPFMSVFYELETVLGEDYHPVGFPTERGNGNFWDGSNFLVVNKDTPYREEIAAYLEVLLSYENQKECLFPVRKEDLVGRISEFEIIDEINGDQITYRSITGIQYDNGMYVEIVPDADGHYWVEDYQTLLEGCAGRSADTSAIENIIWEEVESYFAGSKDAATVADIIQSRVQIYLKEQQ